MNHKKTYKMVLIAPVSVKGIVCYRTACSNFYGKYTSAQTIDIFEHGGILQAPNYSAWHV